MNILILQPQDICYGLLDNVAYNLGDALKKIGQGFGLEVEYFDLKKEVVSNLSRFMGREYLAVIDIYSGLLNIKTTDGDFFWDFVNAPVFQIVLDYPVYIDYMLGTGLKRYYALCMDKYYIDVFKDKYAGIKAFFFPMTGKGLAEIKNWYDRRYDVCFIGTNRDYRENLNKLDEFEDDVKKIGQLYFDIMINHAEYNPFQAFEKTLDELKIALDTHKKYDLFKEFSGLSRAAMHYYRENMIKAVLDEGVRVDVFGTSWSDSPLAKYDNLFIHKEVDEEQYMEVLSDSKISLNLLYCNKAGFSERLGYSALAGSLIMCDESVYAQEVFKDNESAVFYSLNNLDELGKKVRCMLNTPEKAAIIADAGRFIVENQHTWDNRAQVFMEYLLEVLEQ